MQHNRQGFTIVGCTRATSSMHSISTDTLLTLVPPDLMTSIMGLVVAYTHVGIEFVAYGF